MACGPRPKPRARYSIRRLAFGLTGLPPTLAEIDAFVADRSPARMRGRSIVISHRRPTASAWRWTGSTSRVTPTPTAIRPTSIATCRPIATGSSARSTRIFPTISFSPGSSPAICSPSATREQRIATAFNRLHRQTNEGGSVEEEFRTEYVFDRVNTFGTAMLGLTLECARCHDHKFDPILQRDYYSLFAFFNSIDESGLYSHFTNATPSPSMLLWPEAAEKQHQQLKARMAALEARLSAEARAARPAFERWMAAAELAPPLPVSGLAFDAVTDGRTLDSVTGGKADVQDGLTLVTEPSPQSPSNAAMRFSGDSAVVASSVPSFLRTDAFSSACGSSRRRHRIAR